MAIVTLTTDWGIKDFYAGAFKGALLREIPGITIVDITHTIPPHNLLHASFTLKNAYHEFPKGTIHIAGISANAVQPVYIAAQIDGHYFVGPDNGLFSLTFEKKAEKAVEIATSAVNSSGEISPKEAIIRTVAQLATGAPLETLGAAYAGMEERTLLKPITEESAIRGTVIYVDGYGNVITNITEKIFNETGKGRTYSVFFKRFEYNISRLSRSYYEVPPGEKLAMFNSYGYLEIAINQDKAAGLLGLRESETIRVEFYDQPNK